MGEKAKEKGHTAFFFSVWNSQRGKEGKSEELGLPWHHVERGLSVLGLRKDTREHNGQRNTLQVVFLWTPTKARSYIKSGSSTGFSVVN